jgi:hypothetical protein
LLDRLGDSVGVAVVQRGLVPQQRRERPALFVDRERLERVFDVGADAQETSISPTANGVSS